MKLLVVCLLAGCWLALGGAAAAARQGERKLLEVQRQLRDAKQSLQRNQMLVNTPPRDIEDCCCLAALRCFQRSLEEQHNATDITQRRLLRSLKHHMTERSLDFCRGANSTPRPDATMTPVTKPACDSCTAHPKQSTQEFVSRLESLIQRAITRLSRN